MNGCMGKQEVYNNRDMNRQISAALLIAVGIVGVTVLVQGSTIPLAARRLGVPMRRSEGGT